mmetsp:Transcript_28333/g.63287  ORF Transcript_28333/g.63287 Transcript_28333/m.63287 type:complete len:344 (-) Transcript_28333:100-1131(-)
MPWNEERHQDLLNDPRFEAAIALKKEGNYEAAADFFGELLKSFDAEEEPPQYLAPLYFEYGSTLVCELEKANNDMLEETNPSSEGPPLKKTKIAQQSGSPSEFSLAQVPGDEDATQGKEGGETNGDEEEGEGRGDEARGGEEDEDDEEDEEDEDDSVIAWQCLDTARGLYQSAMDAKSTPELLVQLKRGLARTVNRLGDLNMATSKFGDALVEYEVSLKLREQEQDPSVEAVCRLCDTQIQVALALIEHVADMGEVDIVVTTIEDESVVVVSGEDCINQALAFRDQARAKLEGLLTELARNKTECSVHEKECICFQYTNLDGFVGRCADLSQEKPELARKFPS